ncbi:unnamed protein product [Caenorhabditis sp. 36 PRJEB53466]|nr:unnamed protein product [Caenorhabditis sp. 36 PRJEB53466]
MTPPITAFKKTGKQGDAPLTAVVVLDIFDQRFAPLQESYPCFAFIPVCNVPAISYTLTWLMRTEVKHVMLVVSGLNAKHADNVQNEWKFAFEQISVVVCDGGMSVGDCIREVNNRELITGDFLLVWNPTAVTSSTLSRQIADFRKRRRESADNVMTMVFSNRENSEKFVIGVHSTSNKLMLYPGANSLNQLKVDKKDFYEGIDIRRDVTGTGIALCSRLIATQFSDNFDFVCIDDVIREILSKDDILGMAIHVDVMSPEERAFFAYDFESLVTLNSLLMSRWFYPLVPETADLSRFFTSNPNNLYLEEDSEKLTIKAKNWILSHDSFIVSLGLKTVVARNAVINSSSIGRHTSIGDNSSISFSLIGNDCKIGSNCIIESSFIGDNVTIPDGTIVQTRSVVGNGVVYPKEYPHIPDSAVLREPLSDDQFDRISSQKVGSVYSAKMKNNAPFWTRSVNGKTLFATEEAESDDSEEEEEGDGDGFEDGVDDSTRQFHDEVFESMQKILESEDQVMRNLILEINSSKLACNVTMDDVARNVFAAFMKLRGNEKLGTMFSLVLKWRPLFLNYYKSTEETLAAKSPEQRRMELASKQKCQIQMLLAIEDKFETQQLEAAAAVKLVHFLYDRADVLDEEAILKWAETIADDSDLKEEMRKIVDWLQQSDEEESDEE